MLKLFRALLEKVNRHNKIIYPHNRFTIMQPRPPIQPNQMMPVNYQNQMQYHQGNFGNRAKIKPIDLLDWRTTVEVIRTYIGIMIVCALIHYIIELIYETIRKESNDEIALKIADLFVYLDTAFLVSAFIAIIIKAISDTWGIMAYSKIVNQDAAKKSL